jgi:hypothetical protein
MLGQPLLIACPANVFQSTTSYARSETAAFPGKAYAQADGAA